MNKKQLITSVIVLVVLGVITFLTFKKDSTNWERSSEFEKNKLIKKLDVNKVAKLTITTDSDKLELEKDKNEKWIVKNRDGYPANFAKLSHLLMSLNNLTVVQEPLLLKNQFASLKLEKPVSGEKNDGTGSLLELMDKEGNKLLSLIVGEQHFPEKINTDYQSPEADGCYVLIEGSEKPALITNSLSIIDSDPKKWLDFEFIEIPDIISLSMAGSDGKQIYKIYRTNTKSPWILDGLIKGDLPLPRPMRDATSAFEKISFDDVSPAKEIEFKETKSVTIQTERGMEYNFKLLPKGKKVFAKLTLGGKIKPLRSSTKDVTKENLDKMQEELKLKAENLTKQLKKETFYTRWLYEFPSYRINKVLKDKEDLYKTDL